MSRRAIPGVETVEGDVYRRTLTIDGRDALLEVRHQPAEDALVCELHYVSNDGSDELTIAQREDVLARLQHLFDTTLQPRELDAVLARDAILASMYLPIASDHDGFRLPGAFAPFEVCVRAIVGQQVSVKAASTVMGRISNRYGRSTDSTLSALGSETLALHHFPAPQDLLELEASAVGLTGRRAATIRTFAQWFQDTGKTAQLPDANEAESFIDAVQSLKGIGPWTANYMAMRAMGWRDAWLTGDLVMRRSIERHFPDLRAASDKVIDAWAEQFRPYRAYALILLWMSA